MKSTIIFVALAGLVGGSIYYFASDRNLSIVAPYRSLSKIEMPTGTEGTVLGESIEKSMSSFNAMKDIVQNPAQAIEGITTDIKEEILDRVAGVLGVATSSKESKEEVGGGGGEIEGVGSVAVVAADDMGICSARRKNEIVSYLLEFSSSSVPAGYSVDWGDGRSIQGTIAAGSQEALVSHSYQNGGNYIVKFRMMDSTKVFAQEEICVQ